MIESSPPFRDPELSFDRRIDDLLSRLTLDERIALLHQFTPGVARLGIGPFRTGQEALHGVAWMGPATVFPQAVGLGATWNDDLVRRIGEAVGTEARAMRSRDERVGLNVWAPTVNLLRHPLWGRGEEGYSEDPGLTSALAVAYTRGLRGDHPVYWRTAPVLKHWLAHNNETRRDTTSSSVRPRVLHEYDLRAFRTAVEAGAVAGVMPAYNLVNGRPNHVSPYLREHLRRWTGQELLVCSDAGAPTNLVVSEKYFDTHEQATAAALRAGVDSFTDHGTDPSVTTGRLHGALEQGLLSETDIDMAARRQLSVRFRLGEFDPHLDPYAATTSRDFDTSGHRDLAREAAEQVIVLLKNDGMLPLAEGTRIAVVGLLADVCKTDWYSGTLIRRSTVLDGLRERFGAGNVTFAEGADQVRLKCAGGWLQVPAPQTGAGAGAGRDAEGALDPALLEGRTDLPPLTVGSEATAFALIDWGEGAWTLRAPDGRYLSVAADGFLRASADDPGGWVVQETFTRERHGEGCLLKHRGTGQYVSVAADGVRVAARGEVFEIEYLERGAEAVTRAAADAEVVLVVAGNDPHINGRETEDRTTLALPPQQERLWRAAHAANPRTALALVSAYPYAVGDADAALPALLWTAHGGQAAGTALARVLAGDVSPAGRLPQTWYAADADLPDLLDYDIIGSRQTYLYFEGTPLFPFGHGLGYSSFMYRGLEAGWDGDVLTISFTVTNTGSLDADEVAQLYIRAVGGPVVRPSRQLAGHRRLHLAAGAARHLEFRVPLAELGIFDVAHDRWTVPPGTYELLAGASSADIRITSSIEVDGDPIGPRPVREQGLAAVAYDEQVGTEIVDHTKASGDAVTPAHSKGELLFRDCDFNTGVTAVIVEATGGGAVSVTTGTTTTILEPVDPTGGTYDYTPRTAAFTASGVRDLRVGLRGPVRLARLDFQRSPTDDVH
ncbi:glycoside hydrolase family 3 C-terminal domain-containing protein [Streptomyces sp. N2-109]|uniref:Glycoside hydrolase family 3 C-terminal domain-containing protein n=1 Tax=Streptomyces gossypii TaxID=2883101 RepID=A0ABT2JS50_9ACTN|nr:glycoside hydrolase family 3 C-terminal domain-containing protein [Streptomyces gossypii]MCT2590079.1 glycoside hydrolase family 3 C-terminal domain-containing protein [Streptomyces gossypii]